MKKWSILGLVVIVLGAAAAYQIHIILTTTPAESIDKIQKKTGIPVSIFETVRGDFKQTISVSGSVKGIVEVRISPTITERIETIHVQTGQKVTRGELLVTLNARASKLKLAYAQAALGASEQQLLRLKNGSRPEDIEMARAQMAEAKANYDLQQIETQRQETLYSEEATTLQAVQQTKAQFDRAESVLKSAQANYNMIKAGPRIEDIKAAEAQRALAKVAVEQAQKHLDDHYLKAPCDGA
ncbi:MAG: biotin/lipoyl-binding protein, partial [Phycisphaerae bacterium]|nr:biotin/lipoyl-binding protein [Phycisphaerae bacterium]